MVLGGTGFVGAVVCEKLVQAGWQVSVPTRRCSNAIKLVDQPLVNVLELDVHDEAALTQALIGHQAVVNLVAVLHGTAAIFDKVHVVLPQKIVRACRQCGVRQLVHISALGASDVRPGAAPSEYLRSKGRSEAILLHPYGGNYSFDVTVIRPSVIFGPHDKFLNVFARLQSVLPVIPLAGAHARFQPVWVEDVANAVVQCLLHADTTSTRTRVYEACGPEVFTLAELVRLAGRLAGVNRGRGRPVVPLPEWMARLQAMLMELAPGEPLMSRDNLDSMKVDNVASGDVAGLQALGITPSRLEPIAVRYLARQHSK
jgi:NADH dehydrogenase